MKKSFLIILVLLIYAGLADADTYIRTESHTDSVYYGGVVQAAEDSETEVWIGERRMVSITTNRITIVDMNRNKMFIVNRNDSTYCQTALPLDMSELASEELLARLQSYKFMGTVKQTGEEREVEDCKCSGYEVNSYVLAGGGRYYDTDSKVWVCTDVGFDWKACADMEVNLRKLSNYSDSYIDELGQMEGYSILVESITYLKGCSVDSYEKVVELCEKDPTYDVYSVPAGFERKEQMSLQDFRSR